MSFPRKKEIDVSDSQTATGLSALRSNTGGVGNVDAVLGKGTKVIGALAFAGTVEIDGEVEGEIQAKERMSVGENAVVKAKITATELLIKGTVHGDITATKSLVLRKPAKVYGNISAPLLSIEDGVLFEGKCSMEARSTETRSATVTPSKPGEIKISEVKVSDAAKAMPAK